jgi:AcrR family transcriptional regulator
VLTERRKTGILATCCLCALITGMDLTIANLAIPSIRSDLAATAAHAQWVIAIYALVIASLQLLGGAAGDRFGRRRVLQTGIAIFMLGSLLCSDVSTVSVPLLVGRAGAAQGTFYNYFDSLPEAIDAVGALLLTEHTRVLRAATSEAADTAEIVARSARQTLMLFVHRPEVGRLIFDSGLPVDRFVGGLRAHLHHDLRLGIARGDFSVADFDIASTVYTGTMLGACLDLHRGHLPADAVGEVAGHLLRSLGVNARKAQRLITAPQEFIGWAPFPLSAIEEG